MLPSELQPRPRKVRPRSPRQRVNSDRKQAIHAASISAHRVLPSWFFGKLPVCSGLCRALLRDRWATAGRRTSPGRTAEFPDIYRDAAVCRGSRHREDGRRRGGPRVGIALSASTRTGISSVFDPRSRLRRATECHRSTTGGGGRKADSTGARTGAMGTGDRGPAGDQRAGRTMDSADECRVGVELAA